MFQDLTHIHKMYLLGYAPPVVGVCFPTRRDVELAFVWPCMIQLEVAQLDSSSNIFVCLYLSLSFSSSYVVQFHLKIFLVIFFL